MQNALNYAHYLLAKTIEQFPEGNYIDGTLGNGHDTEFILNQPTFEGQIFAFDIQNIAIQNSTHTLKTHPKFELAHLIQASHSNLNQFFVLDDLHAAIYNLGYLPGGDHNIATTYETTIPSLYQAREKLVKHGKILIVVYSGHDEGYVEKEALFKELTLWPQNEFQVLVYQFINQKNNPPLLIVVERIR